MTITREQLWTYLSNREDTYDVFLDCCDGEPHGVTEAIFNDLKSLVEGGDNKPIRLIVADQHMSENHPGGDTIVGIVDDALAAVADGYRIVTWYGPNAEALVAAYQPEHVTVED